MTSNRLPPIETARTKHAALLVRAGAALCVACWALPAHASFFSAEGDIVFQNQPTFTVVNSGSNPPVEVDTKIVHASDGLRLSRDFASAGRGLIQGSALAGSTGGFITGIFQASASYTDVIFTSQDFPDGPPELDGVQLAYSINLAQSASGPLLPVPGFNRRDLSYTVTFNGSGASGSISFDINGSKGTDQLGSHLLASAAPVPLNTSVTITLSMFGGAGAISGTAGVSAATSLDATISMTASDGPLPNFARRTQTPFDTSDVVFLLPAGYTVNSESMGIVDNHWVARPVPEPSTAALWALGLGGIAVGAQRRRASTRA